MLQPLICRKLSLERRRMFARLLGDEVPKDTGQLSSRINKIAMICQILGTKSSCMKAAPALFDWAGSRRDQWVCVFSKLPALARNSNFEASGRCSFRHYRQYGRDGIVQGKFIPSSAEALMTSSMAVEGCTISFAIERIHKGSSAEPLLWDHLGLGAAIPNAYYNSPGRCLFTSRRPPSLTARTRTSFEYT